MKPNRLRSILTLFAVASLAIGGPLAAPLFAGQSSTEIQTSERDGAYVSVPVAASTHLYAGTVIALNSSGYAVAASDAVSLLVIGKCDQSGDNSSGGNGAISVRVKRGSFHWHNSVSHAVTAAYVGLPIYVEDDHTLAISSTHSLFAGVCLSVDATGVWVDTRILIPTVGTVADSAITTAKLSDAVADEIHYTTVAIANTGSPDGVAHITGQVKDAQGNSLTGRFLIRVFTSATSYGAPSAQSGTAAALTNSRILNSFTANCDLGVLTHSDGSWGVEVTTAAGNETIYAHAQCGGTFAVANAAITGN